VPPGFDGRGRQLVDRTSGRKDTFYDGPITTHVSFADPYCPTLRPIASEALKSLGIERSIADGRRNPGPRFSTRKRIEVVPEPRLGSHQYDAISGGLSGARARDVLRQHLLITDYDVGLEGMPAVSHHEVIEVFNRN